MEFISTKEYLPKVGTTVIAERPSGETVTAGVSNSGTWYDSVNSGITYDFIERWKPFTSEGYEGKWRPS